MFATVLGFILADAQCVSLREFHHFFEPDAKLGVRMRMFLALVALATGTIGGVVRADSLAGYETGISTLTLGPESAGAHIFSLYHNNASHSFSGVYAGNFNDNLISNPNVNGGVAKDLFLMYCIDLTHTINLNTTYNAEVNLDGYVVNHVNPTAAGGSGSGAKTTGVNTGVLANAGKIAYLMVTEAPLIYTIEGNDTKDKQQRGLQAAIWKLVYGDNFTYSATNDAAVLGYYNSYLSLVAAGDFSTYINDVLWINPKNISNGVYRQAQVGYLIGSETPDVPVPSSLAMLLSLAGTGAAVQFGRKRFGKKHQAA